MNIKITVLPSFTLLLTTSSLSCASLLPLPLLPSKAQHQMVACRQGDNLKRAHRGCEEKEG